MSWTCSNAHRPCSNKMRRTARCRGAATSWRTSEGLGAFGHHRRRGFGGHTCKLTVATRRHSDQPAQGGGRRALHRASHDLDGARHGAAGKSDLARTPGITASAPNISTQQQVTISGGRIHQSNGVTATWGLSAARAGTYRIGPPSFQVGPTRVQGRAANVEVVAAGAGPRQQRPGWPPIRSICFETPVFLRFRASGSIHQASRIKK